MIVGFTGTRAGMTDMQRAVLRTLPEMKRVWFHHGDCRGADEQAHEIANGLLSQIVIHPPVNDSWRANGGLGCRADIILDPKPYLERNRDIVDAADILIAAPGSNDEQPRGGTWYTIRYARKMGKPIIIIYPAGRVEREQ